MKTFIMILTLFFSSLLADEKPIITGVWSYQTADASLTLENIKAYDKHFKKMDANSTFTKPQWIKIKIRDDLKSGRYIVSYGQSDFDFSSFTPQQQMQKFVLYGTKRVSFSYQQGRDSTVYYVHLLPTDVTYPSFTFVQSEKNFLTSLNSIFIYLLIAGIVLGLIMMTAIYNGALYYFNKEKAFLYYTLMQVFMVGVLWFNTGMPHAISPYFLSHPFIYAYISLFTAFFAVLFTRSFLDTKRYLPYHDKVLVLFLLIIIGDMLYYPKAILEDYGLYSLTTAYFLVVGFLRMRQGYKPARFFFIGWIALTLGILVVEYFEKYAYFDTMLLGSTIEAIMLAIALAYKIKQIHAEKEQQKELMIHQSRLASMGEMLGNIAHQWRQPLTHLSYIFMNIEELDDKKERSLKVAEGTKQLEFMSQTVDDFRDFYAPDKGKERFDMTTECEEVLTLMNLQDIHIILTTKEKSELYNYKNEFKQVMLNLLSNAKEALLTRGIKEPTITIIIDKNTIMISDNAGGIQEHNIQKIFEPYFTTKEKSSGIGLYMSKMIVEKNMGGSLSVKNGKDGAIFIITMHDLTDL